MKIAIIDADLIGRKNHRFPNLACMKIAGYYKALGNDIELKLNYNDLQIYDRVFISKVFTDTPISDDILTLPNIKYGGTGFYYDKAKPLPYEIEHHMPYYNLYKEWVEDKLNNGGKRKDYEYYLDYSIGFTTRGCFRKCSFCVNQNYNKVELHSPIDEFLDVNRKYICLLDDNILGYSKWKDVFNSLIKTGKPFQYKQGMDERILTEEKCEVLSKVKYIGDYIFAFDNIKDKDIIIKKLELLKKYFPKSKRIKFYVFCGYDRNNKYDNDFWVQDIKDTFERVKILMSYGYLPYIMRFNRYVESLYFGTYTNLAGWCNQPNFFKKTTYREFSIKKGINPSVYNIYKNDYKKYIEDGYKKGASWRYMEKLENEQPDIANEYYNIKFSDYNEVN